MALPDEQILQCYFCGGETSEFCDGCDEAVCENCDVVGMISKEHRPEIHLGNDEDEEVDLDVEE